MNLQKKRCIICTIYLKCISDKALNYKEYKILIYTVCGDWIKYNIKK